MNKTLFTFKKLSIHTHDIAMLLLVIILLLFGLNSCQSTNKNITNKNSLQQQVVHTNFDSLEKEYIEHERLAKIKLDQLNEAFFSMDFTELCNTLYANYYGQLGNDILALHDDFNNITYVGKNQDSIETYIPKYLMYIENDATLASIGKLLLDIEEELGKEDFEKVYNCFVELYAFYSQYDGGVIINEN